MRTFQWDIFESQEWTVMDSGMLFHNSTWFRIVTRDQKLFIFTIHLDLKNSHLDIQNTRIPYILIQILMMFLILKKLMIQLSQYILLKILLIRPNLPNQNTKLSAQVLLTLHDLNRIEQHQDHQILNMDQSNDFEICNIIFHLPLR